MDSGPPGRPGATTPLLTKLPTDHPLRRPNGADSPERDARARDRGFRRPRQALAPTSRGYSAPIAPTRRTRWAAWIRHRSTRSCGQDSRRGGLIHGIIGAPGATAEWPCAVQGRVTSDRSWRSACSPGSARTSRRPNPSRLNETRGRRRA